MKSKTTIQNTLYSLCISITNYAFLEISQFPPHRYKPYLPPTTPLVAVIGQNVLNDFSTQMTQTVTLKNEAVCFSETSHQTFTTRRETPQRAVNTCFLLAISFSHHCTCRSSHTCCVHAMKHNTAVPCVTLSRQPHTHLLSRCSLNWSVADLT